MNKHYSQGVAMLTALLVVAMATIVAVGMTTRQQVEIQRTENILRMDQAWEHVFALENWAEAMLEADAQENTTDSRHDNWGNATLKTPINGGTMSATVVDLQGRFNLNNLIKSDKMAAKEVIIFKRLLAHLDLDQNIAENIVDWIDPDQDELYPYGAEDAYYLSQTPPYRAANTFITQISELRMIKGIDNETYKKLSPHVSALTSGTKQNINTATAFVIMSLAANMTQEGANSMIEAIDIKPFSNLQKFLEHSALAGQEIDSGRLSVNSRYFMVESDVQVGQLRLRHKSMLLRETDKPVRLLQRQNKGLFDE